MKHFVQGVVNLFSSTTPSRVRGIPRKNLVDAVEAPLEDVFEFKVAFLLLALADILCPTTSHRLCSTLIPATVAANDAESYDWCKLVIDQLMYSISSFARRFYQMGFAKGCGGCTIFLSVSLLFVLVLNYILFCIVGFRSCPTLRGIKPSQNPHTIKVTKHAY